MRLQINKISRKAVEWLEKEFNQEDIVISFFMNGGYLPKDKIAAEKNLGLLLKL